MDPQAAWDQLQTARRKRDWQAVRELATSLIDWLNRGGFAPLLAAGDPVEPARQRAFVLRFCRSALRQAAKS